MLTWAGIVGGVFAGLWLLTWVAQLAAYLMFAVAWLGWTALRAFEAAALVLSAEWWAVFGSPDEKLAMRRGRLMRTA